MIGKVFDHTAAYSQNPAEIKKFLQYYFTAKEIKDKVILDAGCRVGDYVQPLLQMGARRVIGLDLSHRCLEIAKKRFRHNQQVRFYQGNVTNLERFASSVFDAVLCTGTISYLSPGAAKIAYDEFFRVTKPGGIIIIMFQKNKGPLIQLARLAANWLPLKVYLSLIENFGFLVKPAVEKIIGRKISLNYLKYDILLSLRGVHFGIPVKIDNRFRTETIKCELCSEVTTASYKIKVIK